MGGYGFHCICPRCENKEGLETPAMVKLVYHNFVSPPMPTEEQKLSLLNTQLADEARRDKKMKEELKYLDIVLSISRKYYHPLSRVLFKLEHRATDVAVYLEEQENMRSPTTESEIQESRCYKLRLLDSGIRLLNFHEAQIFSNNYTHPLIVLMKLDIADRHGATNDFVEKLKIRRKICETFGFKQEIDDELYEKAVGTILDCFKDTL